MTMFTSPFQSLKKHRARRHQVRTVLQMLFVSGVIRPSHVEPRYYAQGAQVDVINRQIRRPPAVPQAITSQPSVWHRPIKVDLASIRQWTGLLRQAKFQVEQ
jgi:hypothetical protein